MYELKVKLAHFMTLNHIVALRCALFSVGEKNLHILSVEYLKSGSMVIAQKCQRKKDIYSRLSCTQYCNEINTIKLDYRYIEEESAMWTENAERFLYSNLDLIESRCQSILSFSKVIL